jgi:choline-sulfatase
MTTPRNWLFLQSDNHAQRYLGCYGHPLVRTPTLDRIAQLGTRYANAYCVSPLCCPARAAIATGRYPHDTGYWDNAIAYDGRVPSWMKRLREQGHEVVSIGKLHYRSTADDNGFSEEIAPMHIVGGVGGLVGLLRWNDREPERSGQWELYADESGVGTTKYQEYDANITRLAVEWLQRRRPASSRPWALYVSYTSPHPPFSVPRRLLDLFPEDSVPLPPGFDAGARASHPALEWVKRKMGFRDITDERMLRRVIAAYCALVTFLDEQLAAVMRAVEELGLLETTRIVYTSDHGESAGSHGLFGKYTLLDPSAKVPLLVMGQDVPRGAVSHDLVSHVDLYPTLLEGAGATLQPEDASLPGASLWKGVGGALRRRPVFAEYHAAASRNGSFMLRAGDTKLIHHVGMPAELYDLARDPDELHDVALVRAAVAARLEGALRRIVDPEAVDARAKAEQGAHAEAHGGTEAILRRGAFVYSPPPGVETEFRH